MLDGKTSEVLMHLQDDFALPGQFEAPQSNAVQVLSLALVVQQVGVQLLVQLE